MNVSLPRNITINELELFEPYQSYVLKKLTIKRLDNIFVAHPGFCLDHNNCLIRECHHDYPEQVDGFKGTADFFYWKSLNDPEQLIELDTKNEYLLIHHPWFSNYYHWLCEGLPRLWMVRQKAKNLILLLPEECKQYDFIMDCLGLFKFQKVFIVPSYKNLQVKRLCLPELKPICDSYDATQLKDIASFLKRRFPGSANVNIISEEKVYLSRKKSPRRKVENEREVEAFLNEKGFVTVYNEDYSFQDLVSLYQRTKYLVSVHGAGLTNMLFMNQGSHVLELYKRVSNKSDWHSLAYWYLADAMGHFYYQQICEPVNSEDHFFFANIWINIEKLDQNISLMLSG